MRIAIWFTVAAALTACVPGSPQDAVVKAGGTEPVICYKRRFLSACRDGRGDLWICDSQAPVECMLADAPAKLFAVPGVQPEAEKR